MRFALRQSARSPGFALAAVLTLALAIGANAVVFGVLNALILRPLNVPHPENLYAIERGGSRNRLRRIPTISIYAIATARSIALPRTSWCRQGWI